MARSVLIVDDDSAFRELAERILADAGLKVVGQADSAAAAISAAKAMKPHAALVDVDLPDRNGIALAQELTALPWRPRVTIVPAAILALIQRRDRGQATESPAGPTTPAGATP
jgi:CheY-like chemotaxis protein